MTVVIMGTSFAAMADGADAEKAASETEFEVPEQNLIRNSEGKVVGVDATEEPVSVQYQDFDYEQLISSDQFREYEELGLTCDDETKTFYFYGMEVFSLSDEYEEGHALQYMTEKWREDSENPRIDLFTVRDEDYQLLYFKFYRQPSYDEFLYDFEDEEYGTEDEMWEDEATAVDESFEAEEYGTEDEMWEDEAIAADESEETDEESESAAILGGADGPTDIFLEESSGGAGGPYARGPIFFIQIQ